MSSYRLAAIVTVLLAAILACSTQYNDLKPTQEHPEKAPVTTETVPPPETLQKAEPSLTQKESQEITGQWHGQAQWMCDDNPSWALTLDFQANGTVTATLVNSSNTSEETANWVLTEDNILIQFSPTPWNGKVTGETMSGAFSDTQCSGIWFAIKE